MPEPETVQSEVEAPEEEQPTGADTETEETPEEAPAAEPPRKYAGVFESEEELEKGYVESRSEMTRAQQTAAEATRQADYWRNEAMKTKTAVAEPEPEFDLVEHVREQYPEDPILHQFAAELKSLKQVTSQFQQSAGVTNAQRLTGEFKAIFEQNTAIFQNPELDAEVADLLNEMLPEGVNIQQVIQNAAAGVPMPDWVATKIPNKLRKAVAAVSKRATPGAATERVKTAEKRTAAMAGSLSPGSHAPKAPSHKIDTSKMSHKELSDYIDSLGRG